MEFNLKYILSFIGTALVSLTLWQLQGEISSLMVGGTQQQGAKTISLKEDEKGEFAQMIDNAVPVVRHMLGMGPAENRSDLEKLMDRRRKETSNTQGFAYQIQSN